MQNEGLLQNSQSKSTPIRFEFINMNLKLLFIGSRCNAYHPLKRSEKR